MSEEELNSKVLMLLELKRQHKEAIAKAEQTKADCNRIADEIYQVCAKDIWIHCNGLMVYASTAPKIQEPHELVQIVRPIEARHALEGESITPPTRGWGL